MEKLAQRRFLFSTLLLGLLFSANLAGLKIVSEQDLDNVTITRKVIDQNHAVIPGWLRRRAASRA